LRILFVLNTVALYGANRSAIELACGLQKTGQDIYFFIPKEDRIDQKHKLKKELEIYNFQYVFLNYYPSVHSDQKEKVSERLFREKANQQCMNEMKKYIEKWRIDIIHTNSLTHLIGAKLSRHLNKPHVWHIREALKQDYGLIYDFRLQYKYELCRSEQIICISNYVRKIHKRMLSGANVVTLKDGFNIDHYILDEGFKKNKKCCTILLCGCIQESKGQLDAVKAMDNLVNKYKLTNIYLKIVGDGSGEYIQKIKSYIHSANIEKYIDIIPFQPDLRELRKHADMALMCSKNEALGRVTVEEMLSENLVIGADSAGTKEIIKDGETGYLYKTGNAKDLSRKIYNAVIHWEEQEIIIKNARKYAKKVFNGDRYANRMLEIYGNILQKYQ